MSRVRRHAETPAAAGGRPRRAAGASERSEPFYAAADVHVTTDGSGRSVANLVIDALRADRPRAVAVRSTPASVATISRAPARPA
ncbi:MAG: hypothetical protein U0667_11175 [Chloroflexota bacterium]